MSEVRQIIREAITELIDDSRCIYCGDITSEDLRKFENKAGTKLNETSKIIKPK